MSKQMLQTNIESSFLASSSSLSSGLVDVLLFSGEGVKEYCVDGRGSEVEFVEVVASDSENISGSCEVVDI